VTVADVELEFAKTFGADDLDVLRGLLTNLNALLGTEPPA